MRVVNEEGDQTPQVQHQPLTEQNQCLFESVGRLHLAELAAPFVGSTADDPLNGKTAYHRSGHGRQPQENTAPGHVPAKSWLHQFSSHQRYAAA